jgi:hypothetical protein
MEPWVLDEIRRRDDEEQWRREQQDVRIPVDAPDAMGPEEEPPQTEEAPKRGVLIIPL